MSVLLIAPYRQTDGWGRKSLEFAKDMAKLKGDELCLRPLYYSYNNLRNDIGDLEKYEQNNVESKDVLIQFGLPMNLAYNGDFNENIAVTMVDSHIKDLGWTQSLNLFDAVVVFSDNEKKLLEESGVTTGITVHSLGDKPFAGMQDMGLNLDLYKNTVKFYTDASPSESSGLTETIAAFLSSYYVCDNVMMFVFCDSNEKEAVMKLIEETKERLGIFTDKRNYKDVAVVNSKDETLLNYAHANFDCYINVEYGGKINDSLSNAMRYAKPSIVLDVLNINDEYPLSVQSCEQICLLNNRPMPGINSGRNSWRVPSSTDIGRKMKMVNSEVVDKCKQYILSYNKG